MSGHNGRTAPFQGFSRGVPIVGQRPPDPPKGLYVYQVPALIQWPGCQVEIDAFDIQMPQPMEGQRFKACQAMIVKQLIDRAKGPEGAAVVTPKVVLLNPFFLQFIPQEEVDRLAAEQAAANDAGGEGSGGGAAS